MRLHPKHRHLNYFIFLTLKLEGVKSREDGLKIEEMLSQYEGVTSPHLHDYSKMEIVILPCCITKQEVIKIIESLGFKAWVINQEKIKIYSIFSIRDYWDTLKNISKWLFRRIFKSKKIN